MDREAAVHPTAAVHGLQRVGHDEQRTELNGMKFYALSKYTILVIIVPNLLLLFLVFILFREAV